VVWLGICDGNMQEGSFRCDANVSVRKPGQPFGTRREIKNLNSFRFLQQAIDAEVHWQIDRLEDGLAIEQATVLFNPDAAGGKGQTRAMRSKEDAHDYRYFPDPDLPPLVIAPEWVERVRSEMPELPAAMAARLQREDALSAYDAHTLVGYGRAYCDFYAEVRRLSGRPKLAANWLLNEYRRRMTAVAEGDDATVDAAEGLRVPAAQLAAVIGRIDDGTISNAGGKKVFEALWTGDPDEPVDALIERLGLKQMSDSSAIEAIVDEVLAKNEKSVAEYRAGKDKAFNALVGQVMKASQGKANPGQAAEMLRRKLG
jgi:aspartyl-tRNA(Asn)/glutamyl-tRNA(Gln) amidotransferase subunit B